MVEEEKLELESSEPRAARHGVRRRPVHDERETIQSACGFLSNAWQAQYGNHVKKLSQLLGQARISF